MKTSIVDIIKKKTRSVEIMSTDDLVLLETCAIKNIITYPMFIQLNQVFQMYEGSTQKRAEVSNINSSNTYMPNVHRNNYSFSSKGNFSMKLEPIKESQVKLALRIFVDFLKSEIETQKDQNLDHGMLFEPLLTHLLNSTFLM